MLQIKLWLDPVPVLVQQIQATQHADALGALPVISPHVEELAEP